MGTNPRDLPKSVRERLGVSIEGGHARPPLAAPVAGYCWLELELDPPTATHQAKELGLRFGKGGRRIPTLRDSEALTATRTVLLQHIPERKVLVPVAPPVLLFVGVMFRGDGFGWHVKKPDLDNLVKTLTDCLALRGYLAGDEHVASAQLGKYTVPADPGINVLLQTIREPAGDTPSLAMPLTHFRTLERGRVYPFDDEGGR